MSVVIPTYNRARTLARAIKSALAQELQSLEIIVVDDGSTDETPQVLRQYTSKVTVLRQENLGVAAARNRGVHAASGEFVAFLDSDDEWQPEKLSCQLQAFRDSPRVALVSTGAEFVDAAGIVHDRFSCRLEGDLTRHLLFRNFVVTSSVMARRKCLLEMEPIFRPEFTPVEDWDLWLRLAARHHFAVIPDMLVRYHVTAGGLTRRTSPDAFREIYLSIYSKLRDDPALGVQARASWRQLVANVHSMTAQQSFEAGALWNARKEMLTAIAMSPTTVKWSSALPILLLSPRSRRRLKRVLLASQDMRKAA